jgi:cellulose synthase/poly-beta-1,6-N-acetylglucosamine synthase-like glycosyltransferase
MEQFVLAFIAFFALLYVLRRFNLHHVALPLVCVFALFFLAQPVIFASINGQGFGIYDSRFYLSDLLDELWYLVPFGLVGFISWGTWLMRIIAAKFYRPISNDFRTTTSVVVPSFREDPDVLIRCLKTWLQDNPNEVILVIDVDDVEVLERLKEYESDSRVKVIPFKHEGKRSALAVGIRTSKYEIVVLSDSDTAWEPGLLDKVQMPFIDPRVGGVGTRQNVVHRESSAWRIVADWLINTRYLDYVPIESMSGSVACLSGRTVAYRRSAIIHKVHDLEYEYFFGRLCIAGDDGRLTWLVLGQGYKTVYQANAQAWSMFPNTFKAFLKQRIRWSRNSYRCYLTAMYNGWLWRQPIVTQVRVLQILITPITMFFGLFFAGMWLFTEEWKMLAFAIAWLVIGRGIRSLSHLREHPEDIWLLPMVCLIVITIAEPVKFWAFISMNKQGWLTRTATQQGNEGQSEASLYTGTAGTN